jgi:DNA helicase-2/ATP-dependent DNA helicase PcrA
MSIIATQQMHYLADLNQPQQDAVQHHEGPLLVLAGAGTGKTKVLISRIAHLVTYHQIPAYRILAVTFTNKAAKEMKHRLEQLINPEGIWLGTFHSIAATILRRHSELLDIKSSYTIIDSDDQSRLIKSILKANNIDEKNNPANVISSIIQRWKDNALSPDKVTPADLTSLIYHTAYQIYLEYQTRLHNNNLVDFGDLLMFNIALFNKFPNILSEYQRRFEYILVDEYQDTNIAQYLWLKLLAQRNKNICCVGDDDQSIYGWRGAEIGNILRFERDFAGATIIRLEQNYRSNHHIIATASKLISCNRQRLGKQLWTETKSDHKVQIMHFRDDRDEARYIANEVLLLSSQTALNNIAILVRAGFQTRMFEECFMNRSIPYQVIGGLRFYERQEIRDIIAYIRVTLQHDDDLAFERIINVPKRAIGETTINSIRVYARENKISLFKAIEHMLAQGLLKNKAKASLEILIQQFKTWHQLLDIKPHDNVVNTIINESGYLEMWKQQNTLEAAGRVENIRELIKALADFNNITEFLEYIGLVNEGYDKTGNTNMVTIMTIHSAKGLEFDCVFLPGWEEGTFPHQRALDEGQTGIEEERRLAYVAITRARKRLYISFANLRRVYGNYQPVRVSRFVNELPREHLEISTF